MQTASSRFWRIHAFSKCISAKCNVNRFMQDLNLYCLLISYDDNLYNVFLQNFSVYNLIYKINRKNIGLSTLKRKEIMLKNKFVE